MAVQWNMASGAWVTHEEAPQLVHGIALIRPGFANICLYGHEGALILQIGPEHHALAEAGSAQTGGVHTDISIKCSRVALSLGFRREVTVTSGAGITIFAHQYWIGSHPDFFKLLADKTAPAAWRASSAREWSDGISSALLRESWAR